MNDKRYDYNIKKSDNVLYKGNLSITVRNKLNNNPISFVEVSVYLLSIRGIYGEAGEARLVARHITDENGNIPLIELPVLDRKRYPRSQYNITVKHFRYYPVNLMNVQIYPNVTTEYTVSLTPLTESNPDHELIITPELI